MVSESNLCCHIHGIEHGYVLSMRCSCIVHTILPKSVTLLNWLSEFTECEMCHIAMSRTSWGERKGGKKGQSAVIHVWFTAVLNNVNKTALQLQDAQSCPPSSRLSLVATWKCCRACWTLLRGCCFLCSGHSSQFLALARFAVRVKVDGHERVFCSDCSVCTPKFSVPCNSTGWNYN